MNEHFNINSALAFFFLFFLYGTSIETRQQGISYNVSRLYEVVADLKTISTNDHKF